MWTYEDTQDVIINNNKYIEFKITKNIKNTKEKENILASPLYILYIYICVLYTNQTYGISRVAMVTVPGNGNEKVQWLK